MFQTASVYALRRLSDEEQTDFGLRVLVMQGWPRGIRKSELDLWIPSAGPAADLLAAYRAGRVSWQDFTTIYRASQVMAAPSCRVVRYQGQAKPVEEVYGHRALDHLRQLEQQYGVVTLLCWEPEGQHCHRYVLHELLEHPVIEAGMLSSLRTV